MNWFVVLNGIIYMCAAGWSAYQGHWLWSGVWFFYGGSAILLAGLEG